MNRLFLIFGLGCAISAVGTASTCATNTWTFNGAGCSVGSNSNGVTFTQGGQSVTIFPEFVINGTVQSNTNGGVVSGLFEVQKGSSGNLASGLGPYVPNQGGSPYTGQGGIQDQDYRSNVYDEMLYIEVNQSSIPSGTTLDFLMQQGDVQDQFNVYTSVGSSINPPNLTSMTENYANMNVGALNGGVSTLNPQFSITTATTATHPVEWIAIEADCTYLLLNQITAHTPMSGTPEPRFYGLLLASLLGLSMLAYKRRTTQDNA